MLLKMIMYITIACIIVKFMMKLSWRETLVMGLVLFILWFMLCIILV